jgi:uncharacterized membrane protein
VRRRGALWAAIAAYAGGFSALRVLATGVQTGRFDLGNMVQASGRPRTGHPLEVTDLAGDQISRLGAHFDPILSRSRRSGSLWPSPDMLLVAQAVAIALGALPVYWLGRKHLGSSGAGSASRSPTCSNPPTQWLTLNEFHPVALACPLLLFAIWFLDEDGCPVRGLRAARGDDQGGDRVRRRGLGIWYALGDGRRCRARRARGVAGRAGSRSRS